MRLEDKVALITGAGQGIGKETAKRFAEEGAQVVVCDVVQEAGRQAVGEIGEAGGQAHFVQADVSQQDEVKQMVGEVVERFGRIDVLLNNAGVLRDATLFKMSEEQFDEVVAVNLKGTFNCAQAVAPVMVERGKGSIINVSSIVALYGNFGQTNYIASKAGIIGMTKVWARELGRKGVRVNVVCPGFVETEMIESIPEKIRNKMLERIPLGRFAKPREIANLYLFLASDEAEYVNGAVISVDGGAVT